MSIDIIETSTTTTNALAELRKNAGISQTTLGDNMGVKQRRVSAIENSDIETIQVSTLRSYVEGLGGSVTLVATINGEDVVIG